MQNSLSRLNNGDSVKFKNEFKKRLYNWVLRLIKFIDKLPKDSVYIYVFNMFLTIITFIAILSLLVFVHETGHFWMAKKFGVRAEEFGFGFPPRVFGIYKNTNGKWKKVFGNKEVKDARGTVYSLNWIPLGGFVKIKGEDGQSQEEARVGKVDSDSFVSKKIWQRAFMLSAGVAMNIILAAFLLSIGFMVGLPQALDGLSPRAQVTDRKIQIISIKPDSPADKASIQTRDAIDSINNKQFASYEELQKFVDERTGKELLYKIKRGQKELTVKVTPEILEETGKGGIGVGIVETGLVKYPVILAVWEGIKTTVFLTWAIIAAFYGLFKGLIIGQGISASIAGPVGIAALTGEVARLGFIYVLQFTALLSINLAIINFFPIPALDGGRVVFLAIEKLRGKAMKRELEAGLNQVFLALLMLFVLIVTIKDVAQFSDKFKGILDKLF